jgi:hypothetical protein
MRKVRTMGEFISLIDMAMDELDDLRAAIEYDEEFMGDSLKLIEPINTSLNQLMQELKGGQYDFKDNSELNFITIIKNTPTHLLPCAPVLLQINKTHTKGLDKD